MREAEISVTSWQSVNTCIVCAAGWRWAIAVFVAQVSVDLSVIADTHSGRLYLCSVSHARQ